MGRYLFACTAVAVMTVAATAVAQYPQNPPATKTPTAQPAAQMATVEGCLRKEADVPGRKPNVAERAGIAEDYILTNVKAVKGTLPGGGSDVRATMFEVEGITEEQLKKFVNTRVQIEGSFQNVDRLKAKPEAQTPADDLAEIRGTSIRQVAGECPAQ
jgi:hypothetical protein